MAVFDWAVLEAEVHGADGGPRWLRGDYEEIPLHIRIAPDLLEQIRDGDCIAAEHRPKLERVATMKVIQGTGEFGRRYPDNKGALVLSIAAEDWRD